MSVPISTNVPVGQPENIAFSTRSADVSAAREAMVTAAYRVAATARVIAITSSSKRALGSCTASAARLCTMDASGDDGHAEPLAPGLFGGGLGDSEGIRVARQHHDLRGARRSHSLQQLRGRRTPARARSDRDSPCSVTRVAVPGPWVTTTSPRPAVGAVAAAR